MTHTDRYAIVRRAFVSAVDDGDISNLKEALPHLDHMFKALGCPSVYDLEPEPEVRDFTQPEPAPTNGTAVVANLVLADINQRIVDGQQKYGTKLMTHNGRDALQDLYQELIDAVFYIRQELEEREND